MAFSLSNFFYSALLEIKRCRLARLAHTDVVEKYLHPSGTEPKVIDCLCKNKWDGPVWDVGANVGNITAHVARHHQVYAFEPNLAQLHYLAFKLKKETNVIIVPCALTVNGKPMQGSFDPNYKNPQTGPAVVTLSIAEAIAKFGRPGIIKIDIEGGEYELLQDPNLIGIPLLVEWHREIPADLPHWKVISLDPTHSLLQPKS